MLSSKKRTHDNEDEPNKKHKKNASKKTDTNKYEASVVKVFVTTVEQDYGALYRGQDSDSGFGSGVVIDKERGLILTCAHVCGPQNLRTTVRLGTDTEKYTAKLLAYDNDCDLAIMQVDAQIFRNNAIAVSLGDFQSLGKEISVVGYPWTGQEVAATSGTISSNELREYVHGDTSLLASMVTAAINGGNSGGPVFDANDKLVGVAFQGMDPSVAEGAGYVIPMPVIKHFLSRAMKSINEGKPMMGIPALPIDTQAMTNPMLRKKYGMTDQQSGIRISQVDTLAKNDGLMIDDVILSIDGETINNDGTIRGFKNICARLNYNYVVNEKYIGDSIDLVVLRQGKMQTVNFPLQYRQSELKLVGRKEYTQEPSFYIKNGLCFQPVTQNYLVTEKGIAMMLMRDPEHGFLAEMPKQSHDEQCVVLNNVFNHTLTQSYEKMGGSNVVDTVNDIKIHNMRDLVRAFETNTKECHHLVMKNHAVIVVRVASPEEEQEISAIYDLAKTQSKDIERVIAEVKQSNVQTAPTTIEKGKAPVKKLMVPGFAGQTQPPKKDDPANGASSSYKPY